VVAKVQMAAPILDPLPRDPRFDKIVASLAPKDV
jgi:hypothetical protein